MVQNYIFSNLLVYILNILLFGTFFSYLVYFFSYKNQYQNIVKYDSIYNLIKLILLLSLGLSFLCFVLFLYYFYSYYLYVNNYYVFSHYSLIPSIFTQIWFCWFEFSIDFFGIILLFLGYFVGILSLLALDNRIFWKNIKYLFSMNIFILVVYFYVFWTYCFFCFMSFCLYPRF